MQAVVVPAGQGLRQFGELALAFGLSALIGLEREWRQKAAGLRTHTLVGLGAALFLLVSKYGFSDVLGKDVVLDPSRVAAQIVTGIGFIGGGLIFTRGASVQGLTTAASVWLTVAVGMACAAGLVLLGLVATGGYLVVAFAFPQLARRLPRSQHLGLVLRIVYRDGKGALRAILGAITDLGFTVLAVDTERTEHDGSDAIAVRLTLQGQPATRELSSALDELPGVLRVSASEHETAEV
jgi:putative Mg2+ transporter-C (MgtC) family protein